MKSLVIEQVQNGFLVSLKAHRYCGDAGPEPTELFVYRTLDELQRDLGKLFDAAPETHHAHSHEP